MMMEQPEEKLPAGFLERIDPEAFSIPQLMGLAIAEEGEPLDYEAIAERLEKIGIFRTAASLKKLWHGAPFLRKTAAGRLELIPAQGQFTHWGLVLSKVQQQLEQAVPPAPQEEIKPPEIDDRKPVTQEEIAKGLKGDFPAGISLSRALALLAEAAGGSLHVNKAIGILEELGKKVSEEDICNSVHSASPAVTLSPEFQLLSLAEHPSLAVARRLLREKTAELEREDERRRKMKENSKGWEAKEKVRREAVRNWYRGTKKAVVRCFFTKKGFAAASLLDPDSRQFQDVTGEEELKTSLGNAEVILGVDIWGELERLGLETKTKKLIDLSPPVKTVALNRAGRQLKVTPELILRSTLRISKPLGERAKLEDYFRAGKMPALFRRLQSDLKSLWRLYEYGCLHHAVRLRWGFLDDLRSVSWNAGELPSLWEIGNEAAQTGQILEIVLDSPPGWEEPWKRALQVKVLEIDAGDLQVEILPGKEKMTIPRYDVFAVRPGSQEC